jgi:glutathione S-transferase
VGDDGFVVFFVVVAESSAIFVRLSNSFGPPILLNAAF